MGRFFESEKITQSQFKNKSPYFSKLARLDGIFAGKPRPFCLPTDFAEQNLVPEIRASALAHYAKDNIKWHTGQNGKPSNHLCSSQVCCVNFLFPFAEKPDELAVVLRHVYPDIEKMLPVEDGKFVSFEWIGEKNYLGEKISRNGIRSRGALYTSADTIVMFEQKDRKKKIVLIEWKYTESYGGNFLKYAKSGTDRTEIYRHLFEKPDCPLNKALLPGFDALFYEPFYQFMRQQFLANEMEQAKEKDADVVSVLHIAPAHNQDFLKVTSPDLEGLGDSAINVWKKLVKKDRRFVSVSVEKLFGNLSETQLPKMKEWVEYIHDRYKWIK